MFVAFRHLNHSISPINTIISLYTNSKFTHAQIIFSNGEVGSSWMDYGVVFKTTNNVIIYPWLWSYIKINCNEINEQLTYDFIKLQLGKPFDSESFVLTTIFPFIKNTEDKWHCSNITFQALINGGIINKYKNHNSNLMTPQKLYNILLMESPNNVETSPQEIKLNNIIQSMTNHASSSKGGQEAI